MKNVRIWIISVTLIMAGMLLSGCGTKGINFGVSVKQSTKWTEFKDEYHYRPAPEVLRPAQSGEKPAKLD